MSGGEKQTQYKIFTNVKLKCEEIQLFFNRCSVTKSSKNHLKYLLACSLLSVASLSVEEVYCACLTGWTLFKALPDHEAVSFLRKSCPQVNNILWNFTLWKGCAGMQVHVSFIVVLLTICILLKLHEDLNLTSFFKEKINSSSVELLSCLYLCSR